MQCAVTLEMSACSFRDVEDLKNGLVRWIENEIVLSAWNCTEYVISDNTLQQHNNILNWLNNPPSQVSYDQIRLAFYNSLLQDHIQINLNRVRQNFNHLQKLPKKRLNYRLNCGVVDYNISMSNTFREALNQEEIYLINWPVNANCFSKCKTPPIIRVLH